MEIYNFIIGCGFFEKIIEIWADSKDEAVIKIQSNYPESDGWWYILL